jgi:acetolactate synthase-1/2/3 large subunit
LSRPGGRALVDQLAVHGADLAFGVPGESYLAVLDSSTRRSAT